MAGNKTVIGNQDNDPQGKYLVSILLAKGIVEGIQLYQNQDTLNQPNQILQKPTSQILVKYFEKF